MSLVDRFKQRNSHFVWYSNREVNDFINFMESRNFLWQENENTFYNSEKEITFTTKDLLGVVREFALLDKKVRLIQEKRDTKDSYTKDDFRVSGYLVNIFLSLSIINAFLGWIFLSIFFWIFLQTLFITTTVAYFKLRKKIYNILKQKC